MVGADSDRDSPLADGKSKKGLGLKPKTPKSKNALRDNFDLQNSDQESPKKSPLPRKVVKKKVVQKNSDFENGPKSVLNPESSKSPKKNRKAIPKKKTVFEKPPIFDYDAHLAMYAKGQKPI